MNMTVCIGSSCHLKGSRQVVEQLQALLEDHGLSNQLELRGTFCLNRCQSGVCVQIEDESFSVSPDETTHFFNTEVLPKLET